jgi:hypothetical protein
MLSMPESSRAGGSEIAFVGKIRAFFVVDPLHQFGNEEVHIRVALPVRMGAHIDRHGVDVGGEIGAMVEIVSAQEILVGLAITTMLGDDHSGHKFQQFAGTQRGAVADQVGLDAALAGGVRCADRQVVVTDNLDNRKRRFLVGPARLRRQGDGCGDPAPVWKLVFH